MEPEHQESLGDHASPHEEVVFAVAARRVVDTWDLSPDDISVYYAKTLTQIGAITADRASSQDSTASTRFNRASALGSRPRTQWIWPTLTALMVGVLLTVGIQSHISRREATSTVTYTTRNGERANITLPDGSLVILNVASRLDVPVDYASGNHTVRLRGEAFFTIVRHDGTPFTVLTPSATARVLGTSFVARQYPTDFATTVLVRDGKVGVRSVVLTANQQMEVDRRRVLTVHPADPAQFTFAGGILTLHGRSLLDAVPELDRWYDADIRLGDASLSGRRIVGSFRAGSLADLAEVLELSGVRVKRVGRVLTLYST